MSYHLEKRARMEGGNANEVQRRRTRPKDVCDLSTQSFSEIVNLVTFVDKTLFIKAFLEVDKVVVALAPRRFGKSTNMDMVKEFLKGNKKLFQDNGLKICKDENFFNKYCQENPVIYVDFKGVSGTTEKDFLKSLKRLIFGAFHEHRYLIKKIDGKCSWSDTKLEDAGPIEEFEKYWTNSKKLTRDDVINGLKDLSQCLHAYHNKLVYVLIDEYDAPIMDVIVKKRTEKVLNETIEVIGKIMSATFKGNPHLNRGLMNACVRVAQVLSGEANNIQCYEFLKRSIFSPYFGFTNTEVDTLLEKQEFLPFKDDQVKEWYNGYKLTCSGDYTIYSCYSVLNYLSRSWEENKPCFNYYWVGSGSIFYLKHLFGHSEIRKHVDDLIDGEEIEITFIEKFAPDDIQNLQNLVHQKHESISRTQAHLFLQFLTENGYLNVVRTDTKNLKITIRIPNEEIRTLLWGKCYNAELFSKKHHLSGGNINGYLAALKSVLTKEDKNVFIEYAKAVSKLFDGAEMPENEDEFHCILFVLVYNEKGYIVRSELCVPRTKPKGRLDLLMILNQAGLIVELKYSGKQSSECALAQIRDKKYEAAFNDYENLPKKILMGLHMTDDRKVSLTYTINDSPKQTVTSHE